MSVPCVSLPNFFVHIYCPTFHRKLGNRLSPTPMTPAYARGRLACLGWTCRHAQAPHFAMRNPSSPRAHVTPPSALILLEYFDFA